MQYNYYLHDIHSHPLCGHTLHIVDQPMNNLCADEAIEWKTLLLWEQLYTCPGTSLEHIHQHDKKSICK